MSGTRLVGRPEALFVFSGSRSAFDTHAAELKSLGNCVHLGADPTLAPMYQHRAVGLAWGALVGFYDCWRWSVPPKSTRPRSPQWRRRTCRSSPR